MCNSAMSVFFWLLKQVSGKITFYSALPQQGTVCSPDGLPVLANSQGAITSRPAFLDIPSPATSRKVLFRAITHNIKEVNMYF